MNTATQDSLVKARFSVNFPRFSSQIDLSLPGRGISAIFGPSGSGKSTFLRVIAGLERGVDAQVSINGECWQDDARGVFIPVHERALGYVSQDACLFPHLSVRANLNYGRRRNTTQRPCSDFDELVTLLGLGFLLERSPELLSGGEKQRVAIARALLAGPRLLILDEPLASLDLERRREILPFLEKLHEVLLIPIIYVSHQPDEVVRLADYLVVIEQGRVLTRGPLAEALSRPELPASFADDFGSIIEGAVCRYDGDYGLLELGFSGGKLLLAHENMPVGKLLRVQVHARDLSLSREKHTGTSILNTLPVVILPETRPDGAHVLVRCLAGQSRLIARITRFSYDQLALKPGESVWAQVKSVALIG